MSYESPEVIEYGTVESITEQSNKVGNSTDQWTSVTNGEIVGEITSTQT